MALLTILATAFLGSLHCAAMCGGIVTVVSAARRGSVLGGSQASQIRYHLGRLAGYAGFGIIAGTIGSGIDSVTAPAGLGRITGILMGISLLILALRTWQPQRTLPRLVKIRTSFSRTSTVGAWLGGRLSKGDAWAQLSAGALTALLPCGWLWSFVILAAASGNWLTGLGIMGALWLGSLPALIGVGWAGFAIAKGASHYAPKITALVLATLGIATVVAKWQPLGEHGTAQRAHSCH